MIKYFTLVFLAVVLIGCGGGGGTSTDAINLYKPQNSLGYYGDLVLFDDNIITGTWAQYEYDSNGTAKSNVTFKHIFNSGGIRSLQVPLLGNDAYPIGEYGVDSYGTKILYNDTNNTVAYYQFVSKVSSNCVKIGHYKNVDSNLTFVDFYLFCKEN